VISRNDYVYEGNTHTAYPTNTHTTTHTKLTKLTDNRSDNIKQRTDIRSEITIQEIPHFSFAASSATEEEEKLAR
jgi:hypothetical protein